MSFFQIILVIFIGLRCFIEILHRQPDICCQEGGEFVSVRKKSYFCLTNKYIGDKFIIIPVALFVCQREIVSQPGSLK
jgi:hypothetical protein